MTDDEIAEQIEIFEKMIIISEADIEKAHIKCITMIA